MARDQHYREVWLTPPDLTSQLQTTHTTWHHDVGQHDINGPCIGQCPQPGVRTRDVNYRKSEVAQHLSCERRDFIVVFDKQHLTMARGIALSAGGARCVYDLGLTQ